MTAGSREYDATSTLDLPLTLVLDIDLRADGNVWVRNDLAEIEIGLDLHVGGEAERPEVTGRVWLYEGGKIFFRRVDYEIESGGLDFTELEKIDPYIDIRARTRVSDYEIRLHVDGTVEELNYRLTSDPPLSAPDIIALLTTGRTLEDVSTGTTSSGFTGDVVANYFAGALTGSFEKQIQDPAASRASVDRSVARAGNRSDGPRDARQGGRRRSLPGLLVRRRRSDRGTAVPALPGGVAGKPQNPGRGGQLHRRRCLGRRAVHDSIHGAPG